MGFEPDGDLTEVSLRMVMLLVPVQMQVLTAALAPAFSDAEATVSQEVYRHGLSRGRSIIVERSIQNALIYGIRRAKHFLYIESQYFEGTSCHHYHSVRARCTARNHVLEC